MITLFTRAIYEDAVDLPAEGFLHPALFTDDLDAELAGHDGGLGSGGRRGPVRSTAHRVRDAPGGIRLEFMEQLGMKVTRFHHVSVNVHDASLDEMRAFYGGLFGLADVPRPEIPGVPGTWKGVGDLELHLVGAPPRGTPHRLDRQPLLPRGRRPHGRDRRARRRRASSTKRAVQGESNVQIWINDPAGNTIELQQDPS